MGYKDDFQKLIEEQRFEDARALLETNKAFADDDSFYYANMGWILNHIERYQEAISYLQKGVHMYPDDAWMYSQLGYSYNHIDHHEEALKWFRIALELGHDEAWVHGEMGWAYRQLDQYEQAIEYLENALMEEPKNAWLIAQAAFAYRDKGNKIQAEAYLKKVCLLAPEDDSFYDLANFYKQEARYEEELDMLDKMSQDSYALFRDFEKAYALNRLQRYSEATPLLEGCLADGRDDTGVREELGDAYMQINKTEEAKFQYDIALGYYQKALERNQEDASWILQDMIWIAHKKDDMVLKLHFLDRLVKLKPNDAWMLYHYAKTYANLDEFEKAMTYCERNIDVEGKTIENLSLQAWLYGKLKQYALALEVLAEVETMGRKDCWIYSEMGWDHSELEDYETAISYYEKAYAIDNTQAWQISQLAWNKSTLKLYDEAIKYFLEAESKGRQDGWIYANLGWNFMQIEDYEKALLYMKKATEFEYREKWFLNAKTEVKKKLKETNHGNKK